MDQINQINRIMEGSVGYIQEKQYEILVILFCSNHQRRETTPRLETVQLS